MPFYLFDLFYKCCNEGVSQLWINKYILAFSLAYIRFYGCCVSKPVFYFL